MTGEFTKLLLGAKEIIISMTEALEISVVVGRDEDDLRQFGTKGTILLGRHMVGVGEETHLTTPVMLDVLRPHVITLCGKRGEGKWER